MLTQQEIIDRLNQLTVRYNLTWRDIKYDADKAIVKINSFLGTKYPKMSEELTAPDSTYTVNMEGVDYPIFPEQYIHSVVIPYIAMEVLARDEEFTTIYSKYQAELDDGLFAMFQSEFNRVPLAFRQDPDQGVFFPSDSALAKIQHNIDADLPVFKFKVHYHVNNNDIVWDSGTEFVKDTRAYLYNDIATVKGWNIELLSNNGDYAYAFRGWVRGANQVTEPTIIPGTGLQMMSDVHLYALWTKTSTLTATVDGTVYIKDAYKFSLTNLVIPDIVNNVQVRIIPTNFLVNASNPARSAINLMSITLPNYLVSIEPSAFIGFQGDSIVLPETELADTYLGITIENSAFASTPKLTSIIIPTNVVYMLGTPFPVVNNKAMTIYCRVLQQNMPEGWDPSWYSDDNIGSNYTVDIMWGYNG